MINGIKFFRESGPDGHYDSRFFRGKMETDQRRGALVCLLRDFVALTSDSGVLPILMHGALIGWFWNQSMLPWDADIDLCVPIDDLRRLVGLTGKPVRGRYLWEVNPNYADRSTKNRGPRDCSEPNKIDARFIDPLNGAYIDVTALAETAPGLLATKCPHRYRFDDIYPATLDTFEGIAIHVPRNVRAVLTQEYGPGAMTRTRFNGYWFDPKQRVWRK